MGLLAFSFSSETVKLNQTAENLRCLVITIVINRLKYASDFFNASASTSDFTSTTHLQLCNYNLKIAALLAKSKPADIYLHNAIRDSLTASAGCIELCFLPPVICL